jgi:hypothetical protein
MLHCCRCLPPFNRSLIVLRRPPINNLWYTMALLSQHLRMKGRGMEEHTSATTRLSRRMPSDNSPYSLLARDGSKHVDVFTVDCSREETILPVFSSKEEARFFAEKEPVNGDWHAKPTGIGELVSVLYGPCRRVRSVALDLPWEIPTERSLNLVSLSREAFVDSILGRGRSWFERGYRRQVS